MPVLDDDLGQMRRIRIRPLRCRHLLLCLSLMVFAGSFDTVPAAAQWYELGSAAAGFLSGAGRHYGGSRAYRGRYHGRHASFRHSRHRTRHASIRHGHHGSRHAHKGGGGGGGPSVTKF